MLSFQYRLYCQECCAPVQAVQPVDDTSADAIITTAIQHLREGLPSGISRVHWLTISSTTIDDSPIGLVLTSRNESIPRVSHLIRVSDLVYRQAGDFEFSDYADDRRILRFFQLLPSVGFGTLFRNDQAEPTTRRVVVRC